MMITDGKTGTHRLARLFKFELDRYIMRTLRTEIERMLWAAGERFLQKNQKNPGHNLGDGTLMNHAYIPMYREPEKARETIAKWCEESKKNPAAFPSYLGCEYLVCAHCVMADRLYDEGKINDAWVHAIDAQIFSGVALTQSVAVLESSARGRSGREVKLAKMEKTRLFAFNLFDAGGYTDASKARNDLLEQVIKQSKADGWEMTPTTGGKTLRKWFMEHLKSKR